MGLREGVLERHRACHLERRLRGIHRVKGAVVELHLYVYHLVACQGALVHTLDDALLPRRYELAGDGATDDGILELEARAAGERRDLYPRIPELAAAAGLLLVAPLGLGPARDRLLKRHLRGPGIYLHPIPARDALDGELHVHLRQPREDVLTRILRAREHEGRVLVGDSLYRLENLFFLATRPGPHRERRRRLRQLHGREDYRGIGAVQSVEGVCIPELGDRDYVAGHGLVYRHSLLAHQVRDAAEPLGGARARVCQRLVGAAAAAHDPQDAQATGVRVHVGLEDVGSEGAFLVAGHLFPVFVRPAAAVDRVRGAAGDHVEHAIHPDHLFRARRQNRYDDPVGDAAPQALEHLLCRELLPFEVLLQERVVALGDGLQEANLRLLYLALHPGGNLVRLPSVHVSGAANEPVDAFEVTLAPYRQIQRHDRLAKAAAKLLDYRGEVRAFTIEMVHDDDVRDILLLAAPPDPFSDHLDRVLRVDHQDRAVSGPLRHERVCDKTTVTGGIEEVDLASLPFELGHTHPDCHAAFYLLFGEVEDVTLRPRPPRRNPQHRLPERRLPAPPVSDQTDIPDRLRFYGHHLLLPRASPHRPLPYAAGASSLTQEKPSCSLPHDRREEPGASVLEGALYEKRRRPCRRTLSKDLVGGDPEKRTAQPAQTDRGTRTINDAVVISIPAQMVQ